MQKNTMIIVGWVIYALILSIIWYLKLQNILMVGMALLGGFIGFVLPILLDILLPKMIDGSASVDSEFAKDVLKESASQLRQGNVHTSQAPKTPLRSYPLLLAYIAVAVFVITSTQNFFGRGFVMGLGFSLVADMYLSKKQGTLRERWFSVFRTNLSDTELSYFVWGVMGAFGLLSLLAATI